MKVALVLCPQWHRPFPAYGLATLSAQLKRLGHEVRLIDLNLEMGLVSGVVDGRLSPGTAFGSDWESPEFVRDQILPLFRKFLEAKVRAALQDGFRLVGFSTFYSNTAMSLEVARMFKREDPGSVVVFGGPQCFELKHCLDLLRHSCVDAVAFGEADRSFPALVGALEKEGRLKPAPGIMLREEPATWTESADEISRLDELPFADFTGHQMRHYKAKTIHTCRGCVRKCVFCWDWRLMRYRQMSGERMFAEVRHQLEAHPEMNAFYFADSLVNGVMGSLGSFCDQVAASGAEIEWGALAIARPEMDGAFLDRMRRAGCAALSYGVESGSPRVLADIGKKVSPEINARVLRDTRAAGIGTTTLWMVGFPTETEQDFERTLEFVRLNAGGISSAFVSLFSIFQMMDEASFARYGIEPTDHPLFWRTRDGRNTFPVRVERLRRLLETASERGVEISSESGALRGRIDEHVAGYLAMYDAWRSAGRAAIRAS